MSISESFQKKINFLINTDFKLNLFEIKLNKFSIVFLVEKKKDFSKNSVQPTIILYITKNIAKYGSGLRIRIVREWPGTKATGTNASVGIDCSNAGGRRSLTPTSPRTRMSCVARARTKCIDVESKRRRERAREIEEGWEGWYIEDGRDRDI